MTDSQRIALRLSEIRQRLAEIAGMDGELSEEIRAEVDKLRAESIDLETRARAAISAEATTEETTETRNSDLQDLINRAALSDIFSATVEQRSTDGATRELQEERGLQHNQVPLALLEERQVTGAPAGVGRTQSEIIPAVFPRASAAFLGVDMPTVPVGESVYPVLTTRPAVSGPFVDSTAVVPSEGTFEAHVLSPERLQASYMYRRIARARFAGMDESLRMSLNDALADALDIQVLTGRNGLFTGTNLPNNNVNALTGFAAYISSLAFGRVGGIFVNSVMDLRILMGGATYGAAGNTYRNDSVDRTALDRLMDLTSGVQVSAHVPAVDQKKQNALVRLGMRRDMVAPIWEGITLIPDEITRAGTGEIVITAVALHAVQILRAAGFHKQQVQVAA